MHVFSQPIHVGAGQQEGQLQVLIGEQEGPNARVQPGPGRKSESHQTSKQLSLPGNGLLPALYTSRTVVSGLTIYFHAFGEGLSRVSDSLIPEEHSIGDLIPKTQVG